MSQENRKKKLGLFLSPEEEDEGVNLRAEELVREIENRYKVRVVETQGVPLFEKSWPGALPCITVEPEPESTLGGGGSYGLEGIKRFVEAKK